MQCLRVARDHWNFEDEAGVPFTPFGANVLDCQHPTHGTLFDNFDEADVERRFAMMREVGLNTLRQPIGVNHVFDARTGLLAEGVKNWQTFIRLAEKYDIYLMPVGGYLGSNDWFDAKLLADDGDALESTCRFWQAFVGEFRDHPAIFAWDLRNEVLYDVQNHMLVGGQGVSAEELLLQGWPSYLQARYGNVQTMNDVYGRWGQYASFADVPGYIRFIDDPWNPIAIDFRHYLNEKGYHWSRAQVEVIRSASPNHMVCSGNNGWLFPDMELWLSNGFHNAAHHDLYDFVTIHPYPAPQCLPTGHGDPLDGGKALEFWLHAVVAMARIDYYQKPIMLQEFGWYGGGESKFLCPLPYRSEEEHAEYTRTLIERLLPHANGFINWPLCDMPQATDISDHGGLFTADGQRKALAGVYRELSDKHSRQPRQRQQATETLTYSLPLLFTSRAYQDAMWEDIVTRMRDGAVPDFRFLV